MDAVKKRRKERKRIYDEMKERYGDTHDLSAYEDSELRRRMLIRDHEVWINMCNEWWDVLTMTNPRTPRGTMNDQCRRNTTQEEH